MTTKVLTAIARRLLGAAVVLWLAATLTFVVLKIAGGDPVANMLGGGEAVSTEEIRAAMTRQLGLDEPVYLQYLHYLGGLLTGDLGQSYQLRRPVSTVIGGQIFSTVELALAAALLGVLLAVVSGVLVTSRNRRVSPIVQSIELLLVSTPTFWLGIVLLTVFSFQLGWFPVSGAQGISSLVLPAVAVALPLAAVLAQVLREGIDRALEQPFVLSVRARGVTETRVKFGHVVKHAAGPALNVAGWFVGGLLGGAVLTEAVFGRPGLGQIALQGVINRDMPVVMAVVLISALVYVVVNAVLDIVHERVDPRIS
ncbi:ABC transporter permease [Rhodococcoides kyotonense]|uniref:Peptide/nickel transport system permease protein n=1 Tax=Rhodococcoides kyotonense TaxID=398843 RepID=A0A239GF04_9NOCA|nr:ABC transporter permease [Rhodococcus kyotonensis]SNS67719.1 peptide/nickel transport system permease protein [Rhodococcus kyotonensis]